MVTEYPFKHGIHDISFSTEKGHHLARMFRGNIRWTVLLGIINCVFSSFEPLNCRIYTNQ